VLGRLVDVVRVDSADIRVPSVDASDSLPFVDDPLETSPSPSPSPL